MTEVDWSAAYKMAGQKFSRAFDRFGLRSRKVIKAPAFRINRVYVVEHVEVKNWHESKKLHVSAGFRNARAPGWTRQMHLITR
jgi:hypothetical protein